MYINIDISHTVATLVCFFQTRMSGPLNSTCSAHFVCEEEDEEDEKDEEEEDEEDEEDEEEADRLIP